MSHKKRRPSAASAESSSTVPEHVLLRPEMDRILDSLRARHRRLVLLLVKEGVAETRADVTARGEGDPETVGTELAHNHLPKLTDAGYVEWDRATDEISKGPRFDEIEPFLELIENRADELSL